MLVPSGVITTVVPPVVLTLTLGPGTRSASVEVSVIITESVGSLTARVIPGGVVSSFTLTIPELPTLIPSVAVTCMVLLPLLLVVSDTI